MTASKVVQSKSDSIKSKVELEKLNMSTRIKHVEMPWQYINRYLELAKIMLGSE